ncbi:unnamed protein product [Amoebophrya sp. A25]|nr:unnamed protein product [Amoebophrya sp. A25]|eukprot:GSA25T00003876001.1
MLDRFEGSANLRQIRQTYRIRNVGTNPHELKLFQDLALSNAAIKDLVRHIKEEQTKSGALVLRNQTRITTRPHLIDAVLEQRSTMTAEELFLGKLRALVSVHTAVHVQEIESVWDAFFVPAGYESFAESLEEANLVADSVCLVVEKELSRVMTMTRGYLEEIPDSTTSADIEVGREGVWEVPAPVLVHHAPVQLVSPPSHVDYWTTSPPALHYSNELVAMSSGTEVEVGVEMV